MLLTLIEFFLFFCVYSLYIYACVLLFFCLVIKYQFYFQKQNIVLPEKPSVPTEVITKLREKSYMLNSLQKRVIELKQHYLSFNTMSEHMICYNRSCRAANKSSMIASCYSPLCMRHVSVRNELLVLLRNMNTLKLELTGKYLKQQLYKIYNFLYVMYLLY